MRFLEGQQQQGQEKAGRTRDDEGVAPAPEVGDLTTEDVAQGSPHRNGHVEDGQRIIAFGRPEGIRNPAGTDGGIAGLAQADQRAIDKQRAQRGRKAGQHGSQAPDEDAQGNQPFARRAIPQVAKERRGDKVSEHEGREQAPCLAIGQAHGALDRGQDRRQDVTIDVINQIEPGQDEQGPERIKFAAHTRRRSCVALATFPSGHHRL